VKKVLEGVLLKKSKISGVAQNGSISAEFLGLPTLGSIISNIS